MSAYLAKLEKERDELLRIYCQKIGWRGTSSPIQYEGDKPGLYENNCTECIAKHIRGYKLRDARLRNEAKDVCLDVVRKEEAIYEYKKYKLPPLSDPSRYQDLASYCAYLTTLDTPHKILEVLKQEYDLQNLAPLRDKLATAQEKLKADLAKLDEQLEHEKQLHDDFRGRRAGQTGLVGTLLDLIYEPITEQKSITASDISYKLEKLEKRRALVRSPKANEDNPLEPTVCLIQTLPIPPHAPRNEQDQRFNEIIEQTRRKYCRPRSEVERELLQETRLDNTDFNDIEEVEEANENEPSISRFED